jgi:hypothetical protein
MGEAKAIVLRPGRVAIARAELRVLPATNRCFYQLLEGTALALMSS